MAGIYRSFILLAVAVSAASAADLPSFAKDVAPVLATNCAGCHSAGVKMGKLDLGNFDELKRVIVPGKSAESRLYLLITGKAQPAMPLGGKPLAEGEISIIQRWIDAGAPPPRPGEVMPVSQAVPDIKPRKAVKPEIGS